MKSKPDSVCRVDKMLDATEKIVLKPIGVVHADASDNQIKEENKEVEAIVEIFSEFEEAL